MALNSTVKAVIVVAAVAVVAGGLYVGLKSFAEGDAPVAQTAPAQESAGFDVGAAPGQKTKPATIPWANVDKNSGSGDANSTQAASQAPSASHAPVSQEAPAAPAPTAQMAPPAPAEVPQEAPAPVANGGSHDAALSAMAGMSSLNLNGAKKGAQK